MHLFMKHLNHACKTFIAALGSNATPQEIVRVSKCILSLMKLYENFDNMFNVHSRSGKH